MRRNEQEKREARTTEAVSLPLSMPVSLGKLNQKELGAFDTPIHIVRLMINLCGITDWSHVKVLEPACGYAPFSYVISRLKGSWENITGVEINPRIVRELKRVYPEYDVRLSDYLLMDFGDETFDVIIGNPPYGIIGDKSHYAIHVLRDRKTLYKKLYKTWRGKYNIYGLFIEKSINLLRNGGILCFIVPATWMILTEFSILRKFLAKSGKLRVYYLGKGIFKGLNVVTVILIVEKGSKGLELYDAIDLNNITLNHIKQEYRGEMITFRTPLTDHIESQAKIKLGDLFDIRISPRSPEIRKCPFLSKKKNGRVPLLTGRNLKVGRNGGYIDYDTCYSGYYIRPEDIPKLREWFIKDRIVVGHTKGGKLVAALENRHYAWTGDVYHLLPRHSLYLYGCAQPVFTLQEVVKILNSPVMNQYMRDKYREITPHTTKSQLEILPLIPLNKLKQIEEIFRAKTQ